MSQHTGTFKSFHPAAVYAAATPKKVVRGWEEIYISSGCPYFVGRLILVLFACEEKEVRQCLCLCTQGA